MTVVDWQDADEFGALCDLVASDQLVCLTGAGISRVLKRKHPSPTGDLTLPGWVPLMRELLDAFASRMAAEDVYSARRLLDPIDERPAASSLEDVAYSSLPAALQAQARGWLRELGPHVGSRELILAASLIRRAAPGSFDRRFREAVSEKPGQYSDTHQAILELLPRGILTFNYDGAHEAACKALKRDYVTLNPVDPAAERQFGELLKHRLDRLFLLKAHGSVDSSSPLVLTTEEYRSLLVKNPTFRAFVQNLFTNFNFVMVGYGLDDPDFDLFLRTMADQFADPLQEHIVLRPLAERHRREEVEHRFYGIRTLHINNFTEIPMVLRRAASTAGPGLQRTLLECLSPEHSVRQLGHSKLATLGPAGKLVAGGDLLKRLDDTSSFLVSEAAYSLGVLDAKRHKARLCEVVDERSEADVLGRTLTVLRSVLDAEDLGRLEGWLGRFRAHPPSGERPERIVSYLEYLLVYVEHKHQSDPISSV